jgi:hypothetical protein
MVFFMSPGIFCINAIDKTGRLFSTHPVVANNSIETFEAAHYFNRDGVNRYCG